jgi:hypothetical protein
VAEGRPLDDGGGPPAAPAAGDNVVVGRFGGAGKPTPKI